jgi:predicted Zn-dependent protease
MTLGAIQSAFEEWENATQRKVMFEQVDHMPSEGIAVEIVPSLRADVIGEASSYLVHEYGNYTLIVGGNMTIAPQYGLYRVVLIHEIGHIIGLGHSKNPHSVLYQYAEPSQEITPDILEALGVVYQDVPVASD